MGPMTAVFIEMAKYGFFALAMAIVLGSLGAYCFLKKVTK